uniref:C-type lectin domain-containing protein n=2 Tax=Neogobius melanostomus TaxID=47308 RepID=A0A8C6ST55_9GOBI
MAEENIYANVPRTERQLKDFEVEAPQRRPKVTVKKVALVVVIVLLVTAVATCVGVIGELHFTAAAVVLLTHMSVYLVHYNRASKINTETMAETTTLSVDYSTGIKTTPKEMTTVPPCVVQCDAGWELSGTKCYYFSSNTLNWTNSRDMCGSLSGHLVKIESREEQTFLLSKLPLGAWFWIGLTDSETEGQWKWTDGSPLNQSLTFWWREPDDWTGPNAEFLEGEDCAIILPKEECLLEKICWRDVYCGHSLKFICEKEPTCVLK